MIPTPDPNAPPPPPPPPPPDPATGAIIASMVTSPGSGALPTPQIPDGLVVTISCVLCGTRAPHRCGDGSTWKAIACGGLVYYACPAECPRLLSHAKVRERFIARVTHAIKTWLGPNPPQPATAIDGRFN